MPNNESDFHGHKEALDDARNQNYSNERDYNKHSYSQNKKNNEEVDQTLKSASSLLGQVHFLGDMPYVAALGAAMLKDLLDLVFVGSLPGMGTVITIICSIFIGMMIFLAGINDKTKRKARRLAKSKAFQKTVVRILALILGTVIEFVPGVDFFPVESAIVVIIYVWTLRDRREA